MNPSSYMPFRWYGNNSTEGIFSQILNAPQPTSTEPKESAKQKRDRLSREENKRVIKARQRGGKVKF